MNFRLNLSDAVDDLAPPPPPCFLNRMVWIEYLKSAAAAQNSRHEPKVILVTQDDKAVFNKEFPFCIDCTQIKSVKMMEANKCNPNHLAEVTKC